jgi:hypothetical protein
MKKDRWLQLTFIAVGMFTLSIGLPGCAFLDSPMGASSVMPSTRTQHVSYQERSNQRGAQQSNDQSRLRVAQTNEDSFLERDPHPGWGPVNFLGGRF